MRTMKHLHLIATIAVANLLLAGCASPTSSHDGSSTAATTGSSSPSPYPAPSSSTQVYGSGATFPKPLIESWGIIYANHQPTVQVTYGGGGSGKGIKDITAKDVFFGGSDAPMSASEKAAAPGILQFPETLGLVAVVYNVAGLDNGLKLDGETIGKIYLGAITKWNDAAIAALNPGVTLPDAAIAIVYRSDSSGTTFAFTDFLARSSPSWAGAMGSVASKKPDWTKSSARQLSGNGNDGVGSTVKTTANAIGYVELAFVKSLDLDAANVKSKDGAFLAPTTAGASAAAASVTDLPAPDGDWSKVSIAYAPGATSYPISTYSYMMVYGSLSAYGSKATTDQMAAFKAWMWWALHDGQSYSETLGYAKLPANAVTLGEGALASMT